MKHMYLIFLNGENVVIMWQLRNCIHNPMYFMIVNLYEDENMQQGIHTMNVTCDSDIS